MLNVRVATHRVRGEFQVSTGRVAVVGLSGSGKTSLFRLVTGLDTGDGQVTVDNRRLSHLPPYERPIAFVPQRPSLVPHKSIAAQVAWVQRTTDADIEKWRTILALESLWHRRPPELSGGEQQRAALLRALASDPRVLLLDEALSNIDRPHRQAIWDAIIQHWPEDRLLLFSTHEWEEAEDYGDTILYLEAGLLHPLQRTSQVTPVTLSMARLMGCVGIVRDVSGRGVLLHPRLVRPGLESPSATPVPGTLTVDASGLLRARYHFVSGGESWAWNGPPAPSGTYDGMSLAEAIIPSFDWTEEGKQ